MNHGFSKGKYSNCHSTGNSKKLETIVSATTRIATIALPYFATMTVNNVIAGNLLTCFYWSSSYDMSYIVDGFHVTVRIAA